MVLVLVVAQYFNKSRHFSAGSYKDVICHMMSFFRKLNSKKARFTPFSPFATHPDPPFRRKSLEIK